MLMITVSTVFIKFGIGVVIINITLLLIVAVLVVKSGPSSKLYMFQLFNFWMDFFSEAIKAESSQSTDVRFPVRPLS